jgi:signal transduction histidine kinase
MNSIKICENNEMNNLLKGFLNTTLKDMMFVLNASCGSLFLFDSVHEELVLDSFHNSGSLNLQGLRKRLGEGISGKVVATKVPVLVQNIDQDARFRNNGFSHYRTKSFISIPLFTSRGLVGLINLADKSSEESFSENDFKFAVSMSKYACLTIDSLCSSAGLKQEKETLNKQKSLLEKYASMGKLAAGIVHEINNPLDGVIRYTNILITQLENNSIAREYLSEVKKGLNRIANITKTLLEFSHQVNSHSPHNKKYVNVHELIDESLDVLKARLNGSIQVEKKYKEGVSRIMDFGLQYVFINIIKNAFDAMPKEGKLEISTDIKDSEIHISFRDTGPGMPSDVKTRIFEPFFTTKSIDKGAGLGLAICGEIINKYEGRIEVQSSVGQGSTFTVLIPKKFLENA